MLKLYDSLAEWWPLLSPPSEYEEEAAVWHRCLVEAGDAPARTLLELGSGGGNNASHLKAHFDITLVDLSPGMQAHSRRINPDCTHHLGDMRTVRLGATFDRVFIHDAVCYMTSRGDLRSALETAFVHLRPGGGVVVAPDFVRETFRPGTDHGGYDGEGRSLRYLEWMLDPDPGDSTYTVDYAYMLRDADGSVRVDYERHLEGLFSRDEWLGVLREVGFDPRCLTVDLGENTLSDIFIARRPGQGPPAAPLSW